MADTNLNHTKVSILGLESHLAGELRTALEENGCEVECSDSARRTKSELLFCPSHLAFLQRVTKLNPHRPVVVVSRIPETSDWLDALEAGAADYCASPFEPIHLRWLMETHLRNRRAFAAA